MKKFDFSTAIPCLLKISQCKKKAAAKQCFTAVSKEHQDKSARTAALTALPSARPLTFGISKAITLPMSFALVAPASLIASATRSFNSASVNCWGKYGRSVAISSSVRAMRSSRPPFLKSARDSRRDLTSLATTAMTPTWRLH